jgi:hypothetical protein
MATRANVEAITVQRIGGMMQVAGMDITTVDGTNTNLNDPIGWSVRKLGGLTLNPTSVTSAEVEAIANEDALLDLVELRTLESILTNYSLVDSKVGPREESYDQLAKRLLILIPQKRAQIESEHDIPLGIAKPAKFKAWRMSDGMVQSGPGEY